MSTSGSKLQNKSVWTFIETGLMLFMQSTHITSTDDICSISFVLAPFLTHTSTHTHTHTHVQVIQWVLKPRDESCLKAVWNIYIFELYVYFLSQRCVFMMLSVIWLQRIRPVCDVTAVYVWCVCLCTRVCVLFLSSSGVSRCVLIQKHANCFCFAMNTSHISHPSRCVSCGA